MAPLADYATVGTWLADYARHWGDNDPGVRRNLGILQEFCDRVGKNPDEIVAECLRTTEAGARIRPKARRRYVASIDEFEANHPLGRRAGNAVRSFLIHNGVAVSASVPGS